jgi:hypothetical protein
MARREYSPEEREELLNKGKDIIYNVDEDYSLDGVVVEAFDLSEADRDSFLFADIPKGEGHSAYEIVEVGDPYNDSYGDLRKDILLKSVMNPDHLTNWIVSPETKVSFFPNSRVVRL